MKLSQVLVALHCFSTVAALMGVQADVDNGLDKGYSYGGASDDLDSLVQTRQWLKKILDALVDKATVRHPSGLKTEPSDSNLWLVLDGYLNDDGGLQRNKRNFGNDEESNDEIKYYGGKIGAGKGHRLAPRQISSGVEECPVGEDGLRSFLCPSPDVFGKHLCIGDRELCNQIVDCPNAEDEDETACMFRKWTKTYLGLITEALLRLFRSCIHLMDSTSSFNDK